MAKKRVNSTHANSQRLMPNTSDPDAPPVPPAVRRRRPVIEVQPEAPKRLSVNLPATLHTRFKTACSATNRQMMAEIVQFVERRTAELEAEAGLNG